MQITRQHFHFFRNRELDSLYFALAIIGFGEGLISIFVPIYLWEIGYPVWKVIFYFFFVATYFCFSVVAFAPIIKRLNDKLMMLSALPFLILYFMGLRQLKEMPFLFYVLPFLFALGSLLFNAGYHISFSGACDKKDAGKEVGLRNLLTQLVSFSSPFIGGVLIALTGFENLFLVSSAFLFAAVLPLLLFKKRGFATTFSAKKVFAFIKNPALRSFHLSSVGYAAESHISGILWPLFIFMTIGETKNFGGIISIALLISAFATFLVGMVVDQGQRKRTILITALLLTAVFISRIFITGATGLSLSHFAGNAIYSVLIVAWSSQFYLLSKNISDHSTFIMSNELLYNLTRMIFFPILMLLAYFLPQNQFFTLAFILAAGLEMLFIFSNKQEDVAGRLV